MVLGRPWDQTVTLIESFMTKVSDIIRIVNIQMINVKGDPT